MVVELGRQQQKAPVRDRLLERFVEYYPSGERRRPTADGSRYAVSEWFCATCVAVASVNENKGKAMSRERSDIIVGLDIGTSKIVALVAEVGPEGRLNIIGMGSQDSRGLKKASSSISRIP